MIGKIDVLSHHTTQRESMKKVLLLGDQEEFDSSLTQKISNKGFKVKCTKNLRKAKQFKEEQEPDFILFAGKIGINPDGTFYFEF